MKTPVTDMFGIEFPIFAFSHCRDVVAAVSKAGGLGVLGAVAHSDESLEVDLAWIEDEVGDRPYGVDIIVPARYAGDESGGFQAADIANLIPGTHREFLDEILERYEVPPNPEDSEGWAHRPGDAPFSLNRAERQLEVALAHRPALIANALGSPPPEMVRRCHEEGVKVGALAGTRVHAERHVAVGVDLIIAQGGEGGGHTGEIGTMVLIPEVVDAVAPVPVLAAGGIGRGRQMAASLALGAAGVWCGSVWLTTEEAETHPVVKQKMLDAATTDTLRSRSITGKPARMLRSAWTEEWDREDTPDPLGMPFQPILTDEALLRINRAAHHEGSGAEQLATYFVGQVVGSMNRTRGTGQVVMDMIEEFIEATEGLAGQLEV
ncbi:MAG: nitronate monooxygenase [Actinomycetota bacterium]|nr:nitronate monooxygenase [Actinomycetota bacterium]MEE3210977.1 nitronate monooxygenase [Actinomycetota bacterium]|tara:strand:+ start:295 stop:1428 length:1134 start_codon:yes stop_codon:yes gene_type:complete